MKSLILLASLTLTSPAFASEDLLILLNGESANSALALHHAMTGPEVETLGSIKTLLLDSERGTRLSCDSEVRECVLGNSAFTQTTIDDYELLMQLKGTSAVKLFDSISAEGKSSTRIFLDLGTSGKYGSDILDCKKSAVSAECQLIRTYCYHPGC